MFIEVFNKRIDEFAQSNSDLNLISDSGVSIWVVDYRDTIKIMIDLGDTTTHKDLRDAIPLAIEWRDRLIKWEGRSLDIYKDQISTRLDQKNLRGQSYKELAHEINQKVFEYLLECKNFSKELKEVELPRYKTEMEFQIWKVTQYGVSFERAWNLLDVFGFKNEEIIKIINHGVDDINEGRSSFDINYPVTKDRMRNTLRNWRDKKN